MRYAARMTARAAAVFVVSMLSIAGQAAPRRLQPDRAIHCASCDEWNQPHQPFCIFGNTYYVGVAGLSSVLVVSNAGLILVDGDLPQSVPLIDANIRKLSFRTEDIKLLVNGHTHYDHAGGLSALQRFTGARVLTGRAGVRALEQGRPDRRRSAGRLRRQPLSAGGERARRGRRRSGARRRRGSPRTPLPATRRAARRGAGAPAKGPTVSTGHVDSVSPVAPRYRFSGDATHASIVDGL